MVKEDKIYICEICESEHHEEYYAEECERKHYNDRVCLTCRSWGEKGEIDFKYS